MIATQKALAVAVFGLALSLFSTQASAQFLTSPPPVYVSGGNNIYSVSGGVINTPALVSVLGANFESLAIGPANVDVDAATNAKYAFFLYACDPAGTIIRIAFFPASTPNTLPTVAGTETVYSGSVPGLAIGWPSASRPVAQVW